MKSPKSILLVEDTEDDVFVIKRVFKKAEIENTLNVASDGKSAIDLLGNKQNIPCLLLLDLKLPILNGFEVLEWIRSQPHMKTLPVVVLTSSKESRDVELAYRKGANSYLVKPTDIRTMQEMVADLKNYWLNWHQLAIC